MKRLSPKDIFVICPMCHENVYISEFQNNVATGRCENCGTAIEVKLRKATEAERKEMLRLQRQVLGKPVEQRPTMLRKGYE